MWNLFELISRLWNHGHPGAPAPTTRARSDTTMSRQFRTFCKPMSRQDPQLETRRIMEARLDKAHRSCVHNEKLSAPGNASELLDAKDNTRWSGISDVFR
jgi:hypothetical protein